MRIVIPVACVAWLTACGDRDVAQLERVRDRVCACKTASCAEAAMRDVPQHDVRSNRRTQQIARDMLDCLARRYDAERPVTDPDAP